MRARGRRSGFLPALAAWLVAAPLATVPAAEPTGATILDPLESPEPQPEQAPLGRQLSESDAVLRRQGRGQVRSLGIDGLTWATIDPIRMIIRLRATEDCAELRRLPPESWPELTHSLTLEGAVAGSPPVPHVDLAVGRRAAAGTVLVLSDASGHLAFRITGSAATADEEGTIVELAGRVRR